MVIDGHGGCAATDFVAENLGKNIFNEISRNGEMVNQMEAAIRRGYSITDDQFLSQVRAHFFLTNFSTKAALVLTRSL